MATGASLRARVSKRRAWLSLLLLVNGVSVLLVLTLGVLFVVSLPSVGDTETRIARQLQAHSGVDTGLPLPLKVSQATVAVEDHRFYTHHGIDSIGLVRAVWVSLTTGRLEAGDTITEQLAERLYVRTPQPLLRQLQGMGLAVKLERRYSKAQILEMYLNAIYYGDGQWGVANASQTYFGKPPQDLDWTEASLLAGLPQAPSAYNPARHFALARQRQHQVLDALVRYGTLSQADAAFAELTNLRR